MWNTIQGKRSEVYVRTIVPTCDAMGNRLSTNFAYILC